MKKWYIALAALFLVPGSALAQSNDFALNARGGINVPTFGISDVAESGFGFGFGVQVPVGERLFARANADFGMHDIVGATDAEVKVNHFIAGLGLPIKEADESNNWNISVNAGAGIMTFDVDGASDTESYFAINVGAEVEYAVSEQISLLLSPQGDIAFTDEDIFGTSTAWVWPFTAGVKIRP